MTEEAPQKDRLLNVLMPKMDGFTTCATLRTLPSGAHAPVLMVTGLDDVESINRAYAEALRKSEAKNRALLQSGYSSSGSVCLPRSARYKAR